MARSQADWRKLELIVARLTGVRTGISEVTP
jgi:hypothetical protein